MQKRTLVVVTCKKDLESFKILLNSIDRYLKDPKITIVWNEESSVSALKKILAKYRFPVEILTKKDFWSKAAESHLNELEYDGWVDQQVMKLCVSKYIDTPEYVVIDSKNFFIKDCTLLDIKQVYPQPIDWCEPILKNFVLECCKEFKVKPVNELTQNTTPYIINTRLARQLVFHFGSMDKLFTWFSKTSREEHISPAEFFLYEIFTRSLGKNNKGQVMSNQNTLWEHHFTRFKMNYRSMIKEIELMQQLHGICVSGVHGGLKKYINISPIIKHFNLV